MEALWAREEAEFDVTQYGVVANNIRRLAESLSLKRQPREVDIGPLAKHFRRPVARS